MNIDNRDWGMVSPGFWQAESEGHLFRAVNHPHVYPRGWRVTDNGKQVIYVKTLKAAQDWIRRTYCRKGWSVSGPEMHGNTAHYCVGMTIDGSGPLTHYEASEQAKRLNSSAQIA